MKKILILVEGQTEENFVNSILCPFFIDKNIYITPVIVATKRVKSGPNFKGGITSYHKVKNDLSRLLKDSSVGLVTTMIDFYGLPSDFPGMEMLNRTTNMNKVSFLEQSFEADINSPKFKAFFLKHEFESLLFSKPEEIAKKLTAKSKTAKLLKIRNGFNTPEDINNNPATAPSKRILKLFPDYDKVSDGSIIADRIGLDKIRSECSRFNNWLTLLEACNK